MDLEMGAHTARSQESASTSVLYFLFSVVSRVEDYRFRYFHLEPTCRLHWVDCISYLSLGV